MSFNWVYIGNGGIAKGTAMSIERGEHKIVAVYGRNLEKASAFAKAHGAVAYKTAAEAIAHKGADAVYIATPHTAHVEYAVEALKMKMPVLCEKPVGVCVKDVDTMVDCAKENDTYFAEAMWTWFSDVALTVKKWVQSGEIGEVNKVTINYFFPGLLQPKTSRLRTPETAGGALLDIGVYPITYCYNIFGYPDEIKCTGKIKDGIDVCETVVLRYGDMECVLKMGLMGLKENCRIKGTKGEIKLPAFFHMAPRATLKNQKGKQSFNGSTTYLNEFNCVAKEIREGKKESDFIPFKATRDCMRIMDECRKQLGLVYPFESSVQ